jgi:hypothetical protein
VIRSALRRGARFLGSARLATVLLAVIGVWSAVAAAVPQGATADAAMVAWAASHPALEPVIGLLGLHQAFTAPLFIAAAVALALSTAICAWQRTRAALARVRALRTAAGSDSAAVAERHDLEVRCAPGSSGRDALSTAARTLADLGVRTRERDGVLFSVSPTWSVWGSPVFHWALLALLLTLLVGNLLRAQGMMGLAVGQTKPDVPVSYGSIKAGPLYDWSRVHRSFRVDAFDPAYTSDGIDRGPTPTVSLLDAAGNVVLTQRVYPNHTIKDGALTVYPAAYGLSATFSLVSTEGAATGTVIMLVDFSAEATQGTSPIDFLDVSDTSGKPLYRIFVTVPLDTKNGVLVQRVPTRPSAHIGVAAPDGTPLAVTTIPLGEHVTLPGAGNLVLEDVGYYARLSIVDDWSIPLLYVALIVAGIGLTTAVVARQQIVLATAIEGTDGVKLAVTLRLWRNHASSRSEIEAELARALGGTDEEETV